MKYITASLLALFVFGLIIPNAFGENVPEWVKNTAGWWATDVISETEFVNAIEFLVNEEIIQVSDATSGKDSSGSVPSWIKNNAGWWADGQIDDQTFVNGIEFLIKEGIITLEKECKFEGAEFSHLFTDPLPSGYLGGFSSKYFLCQNIDLTFIDEFTRGFDQSVVLNSHGFRGPEFFTEKPPNTYRIFLIGGSTMFGEHVGESDTKATHLQKLFEKQNLDFDIEIINAGVSSAWSKTEVIMVKEKIINYDPDLLIVFDGWNDVTGELVKNANWDKEANVENWISRWIEICEIGKQNNFETILTVQPILGSGDRTLTNQELAEYWNHGYIPSHVNLLKNYADNLKNLESSCTMTADLTNAYDDVFLPVYTDLGHVNALGGEIIAYEFFNLAVPIIFQHDIETQNKLLSDNTYEQLKIRHAEKIDPENDFTGRLIEDAKITNDLKSSRFWFANLRNVDFSNLNLVDVDFRFAQMSNVSFNGATLQNVLIPRAVLDNVDFSDSTLSNVRFSSAYLSSSNFEDSVLDNLEIIGTFSVHSNFKNSEIKNTVFKRTEIMNSDFTTTEFKNVILKDSIFYVTNFRDVDFSPIKIKTGNAFADSLFTNSSISDYELYETDFSGKTNTYSSCQELGIQYSMTRDKFYDTQAGICVFPSSNLSGLNLSKIGLSDVVFSRITSFVDPLQSNGSLDQSYIDNQRMYRDYYGTILAYVDLSNSNLSGKNLSVTILTNADMSYTDLSSSSMLYADLTNANLTGADLTNANLTGADLTNANLTGADLTNAKLNHAILACLNHPICLDR